MRTHQQRRQIILVEYLLRRINFSDLISLNLISIKMEFETIFPVPPLPFEIFFKTLR